MIDALCCIGFHLSVLTGMDALLHLQHRKKLRFNWGGDQLQFNRSLSKFMQKEKEVIRIVTSALLYVTYGQLTSAFFDTNICGMHAIHRCSCTKVWSLEHTRRTYTRFSIKSLNKRKLLTAAEEVNSQTQQSGFALTGNTRRGEMNSIEFRYRLRYSTSILQIIDFLPLFLSRKTWKSPVELTDHWN